MLYPRESLPISKIDNLQKQHDSRFSTREKRLYERRKFIRNATIIAGGLIIGSSGYVSQDRIKQLWRRHTESREYTGLASRINNLANTYSDIDQSIEPEKWAIAIERSVSGYETIDQRILTDLILTILTYETGFRTRPRFINDLPGLKEEHLRSIRDDSTTGPMEIHVGYLARELGISVNETREILNSEQDLTTSLKFGTEILVNLLSLYDDYELGEEAVIRMVLADYSAGPYRSWKAGLQQTLQKLGHLDLELVNDGYFGDKTIAALNDFYVSRNIEIRYRGYRISFDEFLNDLKRVDRSSNSWRIIIAEGEQIIPMLPEAQVTGFYGKLRRQFGLSTSAKQYSDQAFEIYTQVKTA